MIRLSISAMLIFKSIPTQPNTCRSTTLVATLTSPHLSPVVASLFIAQRSRISKPLSARPPTSPTVVVFLSRYSSAHASSSTNRHSSQSTPAQVPAICCSTVPRSKGLPPTPWCNTTRATLRKCCTSLIKIVFSRQASVSRLQSASCGCESGNNAHPSPYSLGHAPCALPTQDLTRNALGTCLPKN